ncbi:hypothetical protein DA075_07490 [Methylobacterium currus]|uniref:Uncharacterized protein n=1 Tax=Methylobacterium currus TaxID=2051553 RepID=A0A2R4WGW6_9HYPH|nr:hypothetical protein DA075_07490 [Methylobacterium currus]
MLLPFMVERRVSRYLLTSTMDSTCSEMKPVPTVVICMSSELKSHEAPLRQNYLQITEINIVIH